MTAEPIFVPRHAVPPIAAFLTWAADSLGHIFLIALIVAGVAAIGFCICVGLLAIGVR